MENDIIKSVESITTVKNLTVGNDIVFMPEFVNSLSPELKNKVFTTNEIEYCTRFDHPELRFASTWAAKEAVYKAIKQLSQDPLPWKKIEILRDKIAGKPRVILHTNTNLFSVSLSISHDGEYVWAVAIAEKI